jgi:2-hydroxychromene-2-carboxylate isomerase
MKRVDFFFDLSSPYSYLASTQLGPLAERSGAEVVWRPTVNGAVLKATGNMMPIQCEPKARYMLHDLTRWAQRYGVPFQMSTRFPVNALGAMRLVLVAERARPGAGATLAKLAFRALWVDDRDLTDEAVLSSLATDVGLEPAAALGAIQDPEVKAALKANSDEAVRRGAFGVPALFVGDQLFWGNDRLDFVEEALSR